MDLTLARDAQVDETCVLGVLSLGPWQTLENDFVPPGTYDLVLHDSVAHPRTFALVNPALKVYHQPGAIPAGESGARFAVLIHTGNVEADSKGCILLGLTRGELGGAPAVLESAKAFAAFKAQVPWQEGHTLTIAAPA